jgi:hypothetical protein
VIAPLPLDPLRAEPEPERPCASRVAVGLGRIVYE